MLISQGGTPAVVPLLSEHRGCPNDLPETGAYPDLLDALLPIASPPEPVGGRNLQARPRLAGCCPAEPPRTSQTCRYGITPSFVAPDFVTGRFADKRDPAIHRPSLRLTIV
jgi:hypothetical protein